MQPIVTDAYSYSHLLGLVLDAGHLRPTSRGHQLRFRFAAAHPRIIDDAESSIVLVTMGRRVMRCLCPGRSGVVLEKAWAGWPVLFPQAGPGRAHERPIVLEPWQQEIVAREPEAFLRGLIESDGCRTINRFTTTLPSGRVAEYAYPRYFFSSRSADIRGLFCAACERIGVHWTQSSQRNLSVADHRSVALLDAFVGPKA